MAAVTELAALQEFVTSKSAKSPIYQFTLSTMRPVSASKGVVRCRMTLSENHLNSHGSIHGGVSATIVDFLGGLAIHTVDGRQATGVSADIHVNYISGAKEGEEVEIEGRVDKLGGTLAFTSVKIWKVVPGGEQELGDGPGPLVITGTHTKFVGRSHRPAAGAQTIGGRTPAETGTNTPTA